MVVWGRDLFFHIPNRAYNTIHPYDRNHTPFTPAQACGVVPTLLMSHNPDTAHHLRRHKYDVQFSGHTHGGQQEGREAHQR